MKYRNLLNIYVSTKTMTPIRKEQRGQKIAEDQSLSEIELICY